MVGQSGQHDELWKPGDAPTQVAQWAVESAATAGRIAAIGVFPPQLRTYPFGEAFNKNLTIRTGNCPHRRYIPELVRLTASGVVDPGRRPDPTGRTHRRHRRLRIIRPPRRRWNKTALHTS